MAERRVIIQRDSDYNADDANLIIRTALPEVSSGTGTTFQQEFRVHRQTLCAASTVWAGMIETLVNGAGGSRETRVAGQTEESSTSIKVEAADEGEGQGQSAGTEHTGESRDAVHDLPVLILPENLFTLRTLLAAAYNRHEGMKLELTTSWLTVLTVWEAAVKYEMFVLRSYAQMTLIAQAGKVKPAEALHIFGRASHHGDEYLSEHFIEKATYAAPANLPQRAFSEVPREALFVLSTRRDAASKEAAKSVNDRLAGLLVLAKAFRPDQLQELKACREILRKYLKNYYGISTT